MTADPKPAPDVAGRDLPTTTARPLTERARTLIDGARQSQYGEPTEHMARVAQAWTAILGQPVTAADVALCMVALKLIREAHQPAVDNRLDAAGYLEILDRVARS